MVLAAQPGKVHSLLPAKGGLTTFGWPQFANHSSTNRTRLDAHPQPNYHCAICSSVNIDKVVDKKRRKKHPIGNNDVSFAGELFMFFTPKIYGLKAIHVSAVDDNVS